MSATQQGAIDPSTEEWLGFLRLDGQEPNAIYYSLPALLPEEEYFKVGFSIQIRLGMTDENSRWPVLRLRAADPTFFVEFGVITGASNLEIVATYIETGFERHEQAFSTTLEYGEELRLTVEQDVVGGYVSGRTSHGGGINQPAPHHLGVSPTRAYIIGALEVGAVTLVNVGIVDFLYSGA
jgi:hypothetical protein